jgi:hypothetical protein
MAIVAALAVQSWELRNDNHKEEYMAAHGRTYVSQEVMH